MPSGPAKAAFCPVYPATVARLVLAAAVVAALVLLGWLLHIDRLKQLAPGLTSMNPLTALSIACACAALWLLRDGPQDGRRRLCASLLGSVALLAGLSKLFDLAAGTSFCPDDLLFRSQLDGGQKFPSRIAPNAALCLSLLGTAILGFDRPAWFSLLHPQRLMLPVFALSGAALVGYAYNSSGFYKYAAFIPMALHSAVCFMLLALAIVLSRPEEGFMRRIPRGSLGARNFRRLLPACVLVPLFLGGLELFGVKAGHFGTESGASLVAVLTALVMTVLAYVTAVSLNRIDDERHRADLELLARQEQERRGHQWALSLGELEETIRRSRDELPRAAGEVLGMLVAKTGALQASLYQTEADQAGVERLRVLSLYAFDRPQQINASFALGEGLVGQCAAGRLPLRINQVPDSYFRLRSAYLQAAPQHLLFLPILQDQEVLGVLELACAAPLAEDVERFLNSAMRVLAFGMYRYNRIRQAQWQAAELERLRGEGLRVVAGGLER